MSGWILAGTTFLASSVEFVEAATIVMAVGFTQGWRIAGWGAACAALVLGAIVAIFGPLLANGASLQVLQLVVGPFLVLFGMTWLRKAVWRYAGRKALHDEQAIYDREVARLTADREQRIGFAVAFQGVFLEGLEVVAIVVTFGAASAPARAWSAGGALVAMAVVIVAALLLHKPFSRVPENTMKAVVGVMLLSLGTFWTGEALHLAWWLGDATLFVIAAIYAMAAAAAVYALRKPEARSW